MYGKMKLFARKKAENNDGFFFFSSLFHSSSILDMLFLVRFWFSGRGISCALIAVCEKVKNGLQLWYIFLYHSAHPWFHGREQNSTVGFLEAIGSWAELLDYPLLNRFLMLLLNSSMSMAQYFRSAPDHYKLWYIMRSKFGRRTDILMSFRGSARGPCLQETINLAYEKFIDYEPKWFLW